MTRPWKVGVVTTSRADYGISASMLEHLSEDPEISLGLFVGGTHLSDDFGKTIDKIIADGYPILAEIPCIPENDSELGIAETMGRATAEFAKAFAVNNVDILIVLGDRYEMHSAACAAMPMRIPLAHIHGGEESEGAFDNSLRHSMTKLSHLHFCSTDLARQRILNMGENPKNVFRVGAPALDKILSLPLLDRKEWNAKFNVPSGPFILLTYHPVTLSDSDTVEDFKTVFEAVQETGLHCVISLSNADTGGMVLNSYLKTLEQKHSNVILHHSMGALGYYSAMSHAQVMIGNSSSGIIEAASVGLPVINVGDRQKGREQSPNTISVPVDTKAIVKAYHKSQSPDFQKICARRKNVYGDGHAGQLIATQVKNFLASRQGVQKHFYMRGET